MRIAFVDHCNWDINVQSVDVMPLGGSQSAASYLARSFARLGHAIFYFSATTKTAVQDGVTSLSIDSLNADHIGQLRLDVMVCILSAGLGARFRAMLDPMTRLILWSGHHVDQPGLQPLLNADERGAYDGFAMVSDWQRQEMLRAFQIPVQRTAVLRNAIAPAFENQFADGKTILEAKSWPPILAYTSTPFRGLDMLLHAFPRIREAISGARLQVYSSMKVYQEKPEEDERAYGHLYRKCRETPGVEYVGSIPQPQLAIAMRQITMLAYPNTFLETSCIAVMEAMASACRIVTTDWGALPETTAGFATLISPFQKRREYLDEFVKQVVDVLRECESRSARSERLLSDQLDYVHSNLTWNFIAQQWIDWLQKLPAGN